MSKSLKCLECGNTKKFYRDITLSAKLKVTSKGKDTSRIYDIDKSNIGDYYELIRCGECDTEIEIEEDDE